MQLLVVTNNFSGTVDWVLDVQVVRYHWSDRLIVLGEDSLEDTEVVPSHLVGDFIENFDKFGLRRILPHVEDGWLQTFGYGIIPVQDVLRQNDQH